MTRVNPDENLAGRTIGPAEMRRILHAVTRTVEDELDDIPLKVEGRLPPWLDGVLYRNGPGRFERGGRRCIHPVDGDGHIARFDFGPKGVRYRNRFVRTDGYLTEERLGRLYYRGLGTNRPGGPVANLLRSCKNTANTHVIWQARCLLALWEGGVPYRLDPYSLATLGSEDFAGRLNSPIAPPARWLMPSQLPFSAHPKIDSETGELLGFGVLFGPLHRLAVYRVAPDGRMARPALYPLPHMTFVHDMAVTRHWLCFLLPHAQFDTLDALLGLNTFVGAIRLASERPMTALLIPRQGGRPRAFETVPGFVFHVAQAFEREAGTLVLDVIRYHQFPVMADIDTLFQGERPEMVPHLERLELCPTTGRRTIRGWTDWAAEMPTTAPAALGTEHRVLYTLGAPPGRSLPFLSTIQRLDTVTGELRVHDLTPDLPGEALLVPGPGDEEGVLLTIVYRAERQCSELLVLNAADLCIQATIPLPHILPYGFHGAWVPRREMG